MPDHAVKCVIALGLLDTVWANNPVNITGWVVIPDRGGRQIRSVSFGSLRLAIAVVIQTVCNFAPRIGHVRQVAHVVVDEPW